MLRRRQIDVVTYALRPTTTRRITWAAFTDLADRQPRRMRSTEARSGARARATASSR